MKNHYEVKCANCENNFWRHNRQNPKFKNKYNAKIGLDYRTENQFCSRACLASHKDKKLELNCGWCNKSIIQTRAEFNKSKSGLCFCNRSCACSFNNTQKRKSRRSKCEKMLFDLMQEQYPKLDLIPNGKELLNGLECDIQIISLNLAIEWNGIVHYKPIYGEEKLKRIQTIDEKKQNLAQEKGIRLIVVPDLVSSEKYVKEVFYKICRIVDELIMGC